MRRLALVGLALLALVVGTLVLAVSRDDPARDGAADAPPAATTTTAPGTPTPRPRAGLPEESAPPDEADAPAEPRTIRVTVWDSASGKPIAGASVALVPPDANGRVRSDRAVLDFSRSVDAATSAEDGTCDVDVTARHGWAVVVSKDGYAPAAQFVREDDAPLVELDAGAPREIVVTDAAGRPVAGAEVLRMGRDEPGTPATAVATTDAEGRARVVVSVGRVDEILVRAAGFADAWTEARAAGADAEPVRVTLIEGRSVSGVVVDTDGKPMSGVAVTLQNHSLRTGADGAFAFAGLGTGVETLGEGLWLQATLDGWCGGEHTDVWPGETDVRVVLRRTATVRGVVVREDGRPVPRALVLSEIETDADGRFELTNFPSGHEIVWAESWSETTPPVPVRGSEWADTEPGGTLDGLRIVVAPDPWTSWVHVRVVDANGRPVPRADVVAWDGVSHVGSNTTNADGTFLLRIRDRDGARIRVAASVQRPPWRDATSDRLVEARSVPPFESVVLTLGTPRNLRFRAFDPEGHEVAVAPEHVDADDAAVVNDDGTFQIPALRSFWADVRVPGFAVRRVMIDPPFDGDRVDTLHLVRPVRVTGRLVGLDGRPAAGATLRLVVDGAAPGEWTADDATPDADGRFEFTTLPPGRAVLRALDAEDTDRVLLCRALELAPGAALDLGDVRIAGPTPLRGVVVDAAGRGVGGAVLQFTDVGAWTVREPYCTRADGTFDVTVPGGAPVRMLVTRPGHATQFVLATPGAAAPLRVVLGAPGRVCVHDDAVAGPVRGTPDVRPPGTDWNWTPPSVDDPRGEQGEDGGDVYGDLPPGPLEVVLWVAGRPVAKRVEVVAGKTVECVFGE